MDPNVLRVLTDPNARKDPEQVRAAMASASDAARQSVLNSVRLNSLIMSLVGYLLIAAGLAAGALGVLRWLPMDVGFAALLPVLVGGVFVFLARLTALPPRSLLRNGRRCQATVREVKGLGRTIGIEKPGISATLSRVTVVLDIPELGPSGVALEHRQYILGGDLGRLQVGATVPVRSDPKNPKRLAFDWDVT
jgi:hypothetical protein